MAWATLSAPVTQSAPFMCITSQPLLPIECHCEGKPLYSVYYKQTTTI